MKTYEGSLDGHGLRIGIIAGRFNSTVVDGLLRGATDALSRHGVRLDDCAVVRVPGAFELPRVAKEMVNSNKYDAVVCLCAIIRGETPHSEYLSRVVSSSLAKISADSDIPLSFGVLTTDSAEQAFARSGLKNNKGFEAAQSAIEMANLLRSIRGGKPVRPKGKTKK